MRINQNISALNAYRNLSVTNSVLNKSMEKLSSGLRINRAADDAAGLAISEKMRGQIRGLDQAGRNAQDGISLIQTAEGALNETHSILQRMRELAVQAANDTNTTADRQNIRDELLQLQAELDRIATTTEFNTQKLLDGTFSGKTFHIGANSGQAISFDISTMDAAGLGLATADLNVATGTAASQQVAADALIATLDSALNTVSGERSKLGALQNRLEHTVNNLNVAKENLTAAESRIRDLDMANEMMAFTRSQILMQAGTAMLAQANQVPSVVLQLLQ